MQLKNPEMNLGEKKLQPFNLPKAFVIFLFVNNSWVFLSLWVGAFYCIFQWLCNSTTGKYIITTTLPSQLPRLDLNTIRTRLMVEGHLGWGVRPSGDSGGAQNSSFIIITIIIIITTIIIITIIIINDHHHSDTHHNHHHHLGWGVRPFGDSGGAQNSCNHGTTNHHHGVRKGCSPEIPKIMVWLNNSAKCRPSKNMLSSISF